MAAPTLITSYIENRDVTCNLPPACVAGDLILICYSQDGSSDPLPTDWFRVARVYGTGDGQTLLIIGKIATGLESSQVLPINGDATYVVYQYRGVDTTTPIGAVSTNLTGGASADVTPDVDLTVSAVTTTVADSIVFALFGGDVWSSSPTYTYTTPSGFGNKLVNQDVYDTLCGFDKVQSSPGSSGNVTCSMNTEGIMGILVVINAVSSGGGGDQTLSPSLVTQSKTIYAPTVSPGAVTLSPSLLTRAASILAPVITFGAITLAAPLITKAPVIQSPTVSVGAATLLPPVLTRTATLFAPTVSPDAITISPPLLTRTASLFAPVVSTGDINLAAPLVTISKSIFSPVVTAGDITLTLPLLTKAATLYAPVVTGDNTLAVPLVTISKSIFAPTVIADLLLQPPLVTQSKTIYVPVVSVAGSQTLAPPLLTQSKTIYAPVSTTGPNNLNAIALQNHILTGSETRSTHTSIMVRQPWTVGSGNATHVLMSDIGWIRTTSTTAAMSNPFTIASMYIENGTSSAQVTKNGQTSWVVNPDDDDSQCDLLAATAIGLSEFVQGTTYWLKFEITISSGQSVPFANGRSTTITSGSQAWWITRANTTPSAVSAPGAFTYTGTAPDARQNTYCPMILGVFSNPSAANTWFFLGDSIFQGQGDVTNYAGGYGIAQRALYNTGTNILAGINFTRIGAATNSALTSLNDRHLRWKRYCKFAFFAYGTNDFGTSGVLDPATYLTTAKAVWVKLRSYGTTKIAASKLGPRTTSTDSWATEINQTYMGVGWQPPSPPSTSVGQVSIYNSSLDPEVGVTLDAVAQMNNWRGVDPYKWNSNGTANYPTNDGTHPSSTNHIALGAEVRGVMNAVAAGADINLSAPLLTQSKSIFSPTVINDAVLQPPVVNQAATLFAPLVSQTIAAPLLTQAATLYGPVVSQGPVVVVPPVLDQTAVVLAPTLVPGAITLAAPLVTISKSIFVPAVDVGGIILHPPVVNRPAALFEPSISAGPVTLEPGLITQPKSIFSPRVGVDTTLVAPLVTISKSIFVPTVTQFAAGEITLEPPVLLRKAVVIPPAIATGRIEVIVEVDSGAVSTEIAGYTITDSLFARTSATSLGSTVNGTNNMNTMFAGILIVVPDSQL